MSKAASAGMQSHILQPTTTLALMWKITRTDGQEYFYTAHDQRLEYDGDTYLPGNGFAASAIENISGMAVNKTEVQALLSLSGLSGEEIRAGLFDQAEMRVFVVNWANLAQGIIRQRRGWLGEATLTPDGSFKAELRSMAQAYSSRIVESASPECRVDLFSNRCALTAADFMVEGVVTAVTGRRDFEFAFDSSGGEDPPYYSGGLLRWTTGQNAGRSLEVFEHSSDAISLFLPPSYAVQVGDEFELFPGCDKTRATCREKFSNVVNFQGEPDLPGNDQFFLYPDAPLEQVD